MKKLLVSTMTTLLLVIVLTSATFAAPAERELLLKGSLQSVETQQVVFPTLFFSATGLGNATQLGLYTIAFQAEVNIPTLASSASDRNALECASLPSRYSIDSEYVKEADMWVLRTEHGPTGVDGGLPDLLSAYRTCSG